MSQPFESDGGFSTTGNVATGNVALSSGVILGDYPGAGPAANTAALSGAQVYIASQDGNAWHGVENGTPTIGSGPSTYWTFGTDGNLTTPGGSGNITGANVISAVTFSATGDITGAGNISLDGGRINGGIATVVTDGINAIYTGASTTMDMYGFPFSQTTRGQLTISGDIDPTQALGTWYYQSTSTNAFEIFTDSTYTTPVDSTGWGAYGGGGSVAITKQVPAANIVINSNGYLSTFASDGQVNLPGGLTAFSDIGTDGNVYANYFIGNGSQLTGITVSSTDPVSTTGNVTGGNVLTGGLVSVTGSTNTLNLITRNGDPNPFNTRSQITMGYNGTTDYPQFVHTIHNAGTAVDNRIEFWTSDGTQAGTFPANAILGLTVTNGNIVTGGILTNNYYYANGVPVSFGGGSYGNANVVANLAALGSNPISTTGNITAGNIRTGGIVSATGNVTGNYILGNGSQLTGLPATYGNANVVANLAALGSNPVSTTGNVTSGNLLTGGLISAAGNIYGGNVINSGTSSVTGNINAGNVITTGALQGGTGTQGIALRPWTGGGSYAALYSTAITPADGNYSILVNGTNTWLNAATGGALYFRINNNSTPTAFTISANRATVGSIGTANATSYSTQTLSVAGGGLGVVGDSYFSNTVGVGGQVSVVGNVTAANFIGNISITGNVTGTSSNVTLVAGAYSTVFDNTGNLTLPANGDIIMSGTNSQITGVQNISATGTITSLGNTNGTAFAVVGNGAYSNVALGYFPTGNTPAQMAIRDYSTANSYMYFDATAGSANTGGTFVFRSSNAYTNLALINTYGVIQPTKPGFRVYGNGVTNGLNVTTNTNGVLNGNNWAVDYNQGSYLNSTTGVFTAPVAGLYQVNLVARVANNTGPASQVVVIKNYGSGNINQAFWEVAANCTTNHFGVSTVSKLAVGDTLTLRVAQGNINFDVNDNWSVAFLG